MPMLSTPYADELRAESARDTTFSIRTVVSAVRRNWRFVLTILSCSWAFAAVIILAAPTTYEATTQVLLEPLPRKPVSVVLDGVADPLDSAQADSRLQVVKSERLLRFVFNTIDWPRILAGAQSSTEGSSHHLLSSIGFFFHRKADEKAEQTKALLDFMDRVNVKRLGLSYVIEISFRAPTPQLAASVTNSITAAYLRSLVTSAQFEDELLQRRLANVESEKLILLESVRKGVIPEQTFPDANARVISAAFEPLSKSSPKTSLIVLMATTLGIAAGLLGSISRFRTDRTIRTGREPFISPRLKLLAVCPTVGVEKRAWQSNGLPSGIGSPLMKTILTPRNPERHNIIGLMSYAAGAGTTHVAVVIGDHIRSEPVQPTLIDGRLSPGAPSGGAPRLSLPGGVSLAGRGLSGLIDLDSHLKRFAKDGPVLVDLPSITSSFDAEAVVPHLDMLILVAEAGATEADQLTQVAKQLGATEIIGFVLNQKPESGGPIAWWLETVKPWLGVKIGPLLKAKAISSSPASSIETRGQANTRTAEALSALSDPQS